MCKPVFVLYEPPMHMSEHLSVDASVHMSIQIPVHMSTHRPVHMSAWKPMHNSEHKLLHMPAYTSTCASTARDSLGGSPAAATVGPNSAAGLVAWLLSNASPRSTEALSASAVLCRSLRLRMAYCCVVIGVRRPSNGLARPVIIIVIVVVVTIVVVVVIIIIIIIIVIVIIIIIVIIVIIIIVIIIIMLIMIIIAIIIAVL